ncbi:peptidyl-tRNA hydrolase, PTH2 family [Trypanosoma theileri]|uniref:peptidyl-tRNA hydrolase n=1 Tax=Trypanosoma theileri TaxID=67003 RepID=A0A1X0P1N6_9TRYP|nr:peptidyl-tRNA hydrolase, PTH2 family [Trypanosoma theileri]ORC90832.1 peptidyl-tRNA hydrolase, PTH2 family [Trypanosoma theileri]
MQVLSEIPVSENVMSTLFVNLLAFFLGLVISISVKWLLRRWKSTPKEVRPLSRAQRAAQALEKMKRNVNISEHQRKKNVETEKEDKDNENENDGSDEWSTEESEEECESSEEDSEFERMEELRLKMVLVIRRDVKKVSSQDIAVSAAGAAAELVQKIQSDVDNIQWQEWYLWWNRVGCAKITLKCPDAETFKRIVEQADASKIPWCTATSSTSSQPPSLPSSSSSSSSPSCSVLDNVMVVALGPAPSAVLDPITGSLKLLS